MTEYRIVLPAGLPVVNSNHRRHYHPRAGATAAIRTAAALAVRDCTPLMTAMAGRRGRPPMDHAHIYGIVHPATRRKVDPANLYPSFKACVDGIVDAGVIADDDAKHVIGPDMRCGHVVKGSQLVLIVRPLTTEQHAALATEWAVPA
jgi:crossover junction endodeoxyribonuclease RusA